MKIVESNSYLVAELALPYDHTKFFKVHKSDHLGYLFRPTNLAYCLNTQYPDNDCFTENIQHFSFRNLASPNPLFDEARLVNLLEALDNYLGKMDMTSDEAAPYTKWFYLWAKDKVLPFFLSDESPVKVKEPTERGLLEKLAEVVDVRTEDLLNAILHLREDNFRERQADLKEILKNG